MYKIMDEIVTDKINNKCHIQKWLVAELKNGQPAIVLVRRTYLPRSCYSDKWAVINYVESDDNGGAYVREIYPGGDFREALWEARSDMLDDMREARKPKKVA